MKLLTNVIVMSRTTHFLKYTLFCIARLILVLSLNRVPRKYDFKLEKKNEVQWCQVRFIWLMDSSLEP
mgnify:CR=1 FL=1